MTIVTEFEQRVAECERRGLHTWNGDAARHNGVSFDLVVCINCGITEGQSKRSIARAIAAAPALQAG